MDDSVLETLKALRESAANRWEKRREYEWKLSFALWTAIAAFIAIAIGKDVSIKMTAGVEIAVAVCGVTITLLHCIYLLGIITNTVNDLDKMEWVEEAMYAAVPADMLKRRWPSFSFGRFARRHGFLQAAITGVLCAAAFFAIMAPRSEKVPSPIASPTPSIVK